MRGSPFVLWVICLTAVMFLVGLDFFLEDTVSSRNGIEQIEQVFGVKPVNFPITYLALSIAPQVGQVVLFYLYLTDTRKNRWALLVAGLFFMIDFISDLQDRSNGHFLPLTGGVNLDVQTAVSAGFTLLAYTVGSELFLSVSVGLFLVLVADGITQYALLIIQIKNAWKKANERIKEAHDYNAGGNGRSSSNRPRQEERGSGRFQPERESNR